MGQLGWGADIAPTQVQGACLFALHPSAGNELGADLEYYHQRHQRQNVVFLGVGDLNDRAAQLLFALLLTMTRVL
jgi:hypothetical protein